MGMALHKEGGILYRRGEAKDIPAVADLIRFAYANAMFDLMDLIESGLTLDEILVTMLQSDVGHARVNNAIVAELYGIVTGMILTFPVKPFEYREENIPGQWISFYSSFFNPAFGEDGMYAIHSFAVYPEHQNRNIGKTLLAMAQDRAREEGYSTMIVGTGESNSIAHKVYESLGFRVTGAELLVGVDILECPL